VPSVRRYGRIILYILFVLIGILMVILKAFKYNGDD